MFSVPQAVLSDQRSQKQLLESSGGVASVDQVEWSASVFIIRSSYQNNILGQEQKWFVLRIGELVLCWKHVTVQCWEISFFVEDHDKDMVNELEDSSLNPMMLDLFTYVLFTIAESTNLSESLSVWVSSDGLTHHHSVDLTWLDLRSECSLTTSNGYQRSMDRVMAMAMSMTMILDFGAVTLTNQTRTQP